MQPVMQPLAVTWQLTPHRFNGLWDDSVDSVDSVDNKLLPEFCDW